MPNKEITNQIEFYIDEADCLSGIIQRSNFVIDKLEGREDMQAEYLEELRPFVQEYLEVITKLHGLLEQYFDLERKTPPIRNLRYYRLYKLILKDLSKPVPPALK